ncbi:DUF6891 domain-containing protein [Nocardioides alcanivorans]|uniref:DUF6891 domain-containing protein n=1 Tax=Nocardioides alcanivorans TaxID=2897352 RepID=UPI001F1D6A1F|nr:hypothetical protein [Nocardioides alcanivorans]
MSRRTAADELRDLARLLLRAGLTAPEETRRELGDAIARDLKVSDAFAVADEWLAAAREDLLLEQQSWPARTDDDALQEAFAELESRAVRVLQGVPDHWTAKAELDRVGEQLRGVVWFTQPDVWHAIDEGMLELNLWHADTANAAPGDELLADTLEILERHGMTGHFDEGRIEVSAHWRRRL